MKNKKIVRVRVTHYKKQKSIDDTLVAQKAYLEENVKVSDEQVRAFIQENRDNPQLKDKSLTEIALTESYFLCLQLKDKSLTEITLQVQF